MIDDDVVVRYVNAPGKFHGCTRLEDDTYIIYINKSLNHEQNLRTYAHELMHIRRGDYEKKCSADLIEFFAHLEE